ncbi:nucleotidyltransferase substrate binding protein [methane-oxidizing endosymbiont of Gigantopelta aegis]|uniref:nucleotidyltransferase substrate binding protein n=1 Tax=methane-oxidizing endosymbiont of Gigantopelta aegis TaxID=2794938 RepID=UPI0018DE0AE5|nr:nucleotidyltransferase substrate binding protein [methane-oxidizing endosymbiont of Gigantopelta aegis]
MNAPEIRWQQRFANFQRAFLLLREAIEKDPAQLSQLEKEGIIQRFEYTFELAWKVLKDRMESDGIVLDKISPKAVIRQAFNAKYIENPDIWLKMIGDRNLMSHTYDFAKFEIIIQSIRDSYLSLLDEWYLSLLDDIHNA